ncbi:MAG: flagellar brake protein [Thermacetogeniaceae bacterium]
MTPEELKINKRVEIIIEKSYYAGSYPSRVEEILPDAIVLAAPLKRGVVVPLRVGDTIKVNFYGKTGGYSFTTKVTATSYKKIPLIAVEKPQEFTKIQRRSYIRVPARIPVRFTLLDDQKQPTDLNSSSETIDISGGGVALLSSTPIPCGSYLEMELDVPRKGTIRVLGKVARTEEKKTEYGKTTLLGISFVEIDESDRDKIIQYVFEIQREMRRKGLI